MADSWLSRQTTAEDRRLELERAIAAAWLEELRDALEVDHQTWRTEDVDGLTPLGDSIGKRAADTAAKARREITRALAPIRGKRAIPPYALIALKPIDAYISFEAHFLHEDSNVATSGGCYLRREAAGYPTMVLNAGTALSVEQTVAHELTHHALVDANLPLWAEEGITQMMEERVVGIANFSLDSERAGRQRDRWQGDEIELFIDGTGFSSPNDDDQDLAYHLSQWAVRRALERDRDKFFEFLRACSELEPELAAAAALHCSQAEFVRTTCGIR